MFPKRQARTVEISYNDGGTVAVEKAAAVAFEPFTKTVTFARGAGFVVDRVEANQDSKFGSEAITATGGAVVSLGPGFLSDAKGQSAFSVTFRVLQPVTYSVAGSILWDELSPDPGASSPTVKLTGAQGVIYQSDPRFPMPRPSILPRAASCNPENIRSKPMPHRLSHPAEAVRPRITRSLSESCRTGRSGRALEMSINFWEQCWVRSARGGNITPIPVTPRELVNLALNAPSTTAPKTQSLALVSDRLDRSLRVAVWDSKTNTVVSDLGTVTLQPGLAQENNTLSIGDWVITKTGRFLDVLGGVDSVLTIVSRATVDPSAGSSVNRLIAAPTVGQINYLDEGSVAKTEIITEGALFTGRKLGTTP